MITKIELSEVIRDSYIKEGDGSFHFKETDPGKHGLKDVDFTNCGHYVTLSADLLKDSCEIYIKVFNDVYLRKDCDMVSILQKGDQLYLVLIEVKTTRSEVYRKGIYQIPGCYYRMKSLLNTFKSVDFNNMKECALFIYAEDAPPVATIKSGVENHLAAKVNMVNPPTLSKQKIENKHRKVQPKTLAYLDGVDFGMDKMPIKQEYIMGSLPYVVWPVKYNGASVNMGDFLSLL